MQNRELNALVYQLVRVLEDQGATTATQIIRDMRDEIEKVEAKERDFEFLQDLIFEMVGLLPASAIDDLSSDQNQRIDDIMGDAW